MTAKEYLVKAYSIKLLIGSKKRLIKSLESQAMKCTSNFSQSVQGGNRRGFDEIVEKIDSLKNVIATEMLKYYEMLSEINATIEQVESIEEKTLLSMRYLEHMNMTKVAKLMNYSERQIRRIHGNALNSIQKIIDVRFCP